MIRLVVRLFGRGKQLAGRPTAADYSPNNEGKRQQPTVFDNPLPYFQQTSEFERLLNAKLSVADACRFFPRLAEQTKQEWRITFPKFAYFVERLFESASERTSVQSYQLFIGLVGLYKSSGNIRSQNLTKIYNKLLGEILSKQLPLNTLITVILHVSYYNPAKARYLLHEHRELIAQVSQS